MPGCIILGARGIPALLELARPRGVRLINTPGAVLLGIVYGYLPLMILPIYVSLERLDRRLLEASADLGATPWLDLPAVTLPLSLPGVMTGFSLVMILLLGEYLIPALLGGGKVFFIGNALVDLFLQSRNWPFGAAVAVALVRRHAGAVAVYMRCVLGRGAARDVWCSDLMRAFVIAVYLLPLCADRAGRAVLLQCRAATRATSRLLAAMVRQGAVQPVPDRGAAEQPDRRRHQLGRARGRVRHRWRRSAWQRVGGRTRAVFDALFCVAIVVPGRRHRHRDAGRARRAVRRASIRSWPRSGLASTPPQAALGYGSIIAAHGLFTMALVTMIVRARLGRPGPRPGRGVERSLRHAADDVPADRPAADHAGDPRRLPARLHLLLRRFHHRLLRRRRRRRPCRSMSSPRSAAA